MTIAWRQKLRKIRESKGLSHVELCEATGGHVSPNAIRMFENGAWDMENSSFARVLDALGVTLEEFFTEDVLN